MSILYFPLTAVIKPRGSQNPIPFDSSNLLPFADMIRIAIDRQIQPQDGDIGLIAYCEVDAMIAEKILSAHPDVEEHNGILVGTVTIETSSELSGHELISLKESLLDMFDEDGYGWGLREECIETALGELYVGFGQDSDCIGKSSETVMGIIRKEEARTKIEAFVERHNRIPLLRECTSTNGLPCALTITRLFGMPAGKYLRTLLPAKPDAAPRRNYRQRHKWNPSDVLGALDAFVRENNRLPRTTDLVHNTLLPYPAYISQVMGMTLEELCDIRYPKFRGEKVEAAQKRFHRKHGYLLESIEFAAK